jgi:uncharacterized protein (DUF2062 family)
MSISGSTLTCFRPAVAAPTFNNAATLMNVLRDLGALGLPVFVVDDGSTDETGAMLAQWKGGDADRFVITHAANRGKAAALRSAFDAALGCGFTHVITIDTDGQLCAEDIPALLTAAEANPAALVLGMRDEFAADYPMRSRWGRRASNLMVRLECGQRVGDSQCGLRVYPLAVISTLRCRAERFAFETEIITRCSWAGVPIVSMPVRCRYFPTDQRISHLKPVRETLRAVGLHARLLGQLLLPWPRAAAHPSDISWSWRQAAQWFSPPRAWRELRENAIGRTDFAVGFAIGVFIANLPLYGLQTILSLFCARRLHLHPLSVLSGSQISAPPLGPVLVAMAVAVGHFILRGSLPASADFHLVRAGPLLLDWIVGSLFVGATLAMASFIAMCILLRAAFARQTTEAAE